MERTESRRVAGWEWCAALLAAVLVVAATLAVDRKSVSDEPAPVAKRVQATPLPSPEVEPAAAVAHHEVGGAEPNPAPPSALRASAPSELEVVGTLELPKLGVRQTLFEGLELSVLRHGPGLWPNRGVPGSGNAVVAGHRTTHTRPFRHIDQLREGDEIVIGTDAGRFVYRVTEYFVVTDKEAWIAARTSEPIVTLFACHPPGSARYRYVLRGELASSPAPPPAPAPTPTPTPTPAPGVLPFFS